MIGHGKPVNHVAFSPDGRYIASGSFDKKIKLWDGYTGEFMCTFDGHVGPVYVMSWSVDSRFIISASQDSTLKLWDIKTRKLMMDLPGHADQIYALDWDINGRLVASGGKDRQVKLWTHWLVLFMPLWINFRLLIKDIWAFLASIGGSSSVIQAQRSLPEPQIRSDWPLERKTYLR